MSDNSLRRDWKEQQAKKQDVSNAIPALMGNGHGVIEVPNQPGFVYVRLGDDDLGQAFNNRCPLGDDLAIYVGYDPILDPDRRIFQVLSVRAADYAAAGFTPPANVGPHHTTHEYGGGDDVYIDWRRLMGFRVGRATGFTVTVDDGVILRLAQWNYIAAQTLDLTALQPAGLNSCYVLISLDTAGVAQATAGVTVMGALDISDCPVPPDGELALAAVRLYGTQTAIGDTPTYPDIVDLRFPVSYQEGTGAGSTSAVLDQVQETINGAYAAGALYGQSFTASIDGNLAFVDIFGIRDVGGVFTDPTPGAIKIRAGEDIAGALLATGTAVTSLGDGFWYRVTLDANPALTAGNQYCIMWDDSGGADVNAWYLDTTGSYAGGQGYNGAWSATFDFAFKTWMIIRGLPAATAQYQILTTDANPYPALWSSFFLRGTAGGTTSLAVTNAKTLTLTATDSWNLTVPATGTAALLQVANVFTQIQSITDVSYVSGFRLNTQGAPGGFFTDYATFAGTRDDRIWMTYNFVPVAGVMARSDLTKPAIYFLLEGDYNNGATHITEYNFDYYGIGGTYRRWLHQGTDHTTHTGDWIFWSGDASGTGDLAIDQYKDVLIGGLTGAGNVRLAVKSATNDASKYALQIKNSDSTELFSQKNDGTTLITGLASVIGQDILTIHNSTQLNKWAFTQIGNPTSDIALKGYDSAGVAKFQFTTGATATFIVPILLIGRSTDLTNSAVSIQQNLNNPIATFYTAGGQECGSISTVGAADVSKRAVLKLNNVTTNTILLHGNGTSFLNGGSVAIGQTAAAAKLDVLGTADAQQLLVTGFTTQANATPLVQFTRNNTAAGVQAMLGLTALSSGANGDGGSILLNGKSSTTAAQSMGLINWQWVDSTHATRKAKLGISAYDTAVRSCVEFAADGVAGITRTIAAVEGAYATTAINLTLTSAHHWVKVTAACTITLPTAAGITGREYIIAATADNVIVDGSGAETISGSATQTLATYDSIRIKSDGANWFIT